MQRRAFLAALLGGTVAAVLGGAARAVVGPVKEWDMRWSKGTTVTLPGDPYRVFWDATITITDSGTGEAIALKPNEDGVWLVDGPIRVGDLVIKGPV